LAANLTYNSLNSHGRRPPGNVEVVQHGTSLLSTAQACSAWQNSAPHGAGQKNEPERVGRATIEKEGDHRKGWGGRPWCLFRRCYLTCYECIQRLAQSAAQTSTIGCPFPLLPCADLPKVLARRLPIADPATWHDAAGISIDAGAVAGAIDACGRSLILPAALGQGARDPLVLRLPARRHQVNFATPPKTREVTSAARSSALACRYTREYRYTQEYHQTLTRAFPLRDALLAATRRCTYGALGGWA